MIKELKYRFFINTAKKAKQLMRDKKRLERKKHEEKKHRRNEKIKNQESLKHLSIRNQRRIIRLRKKKTSKEIVKLLHQEMIEHKISQEQLIASIHFLKEKQKKIKTELKTIAKKQVMIEETKKQITKISKELKEVNDKETKKQLKEKIIEIKKLLKKKEEELKAILD